MVHAWLTIPRAEKFKGSTNSESISQDELPEYGVALPKLDLVSLLQTNKLPPHKGVVEGVLVGGDEAPSPVNVQTFENIDILSRLFKRADVTFYPFSCSHGDRVEGNAPASGRDHQT